MVLLVLYIYHTHGSLEILLNICSSWQLSDLSGVLMTTSTWSSCFTQNLPQSDLGSAFSFPRLKMFDHASYLYQCPWRMAAVVSSRPCGWIAGCAGRFERAACLWIVIAAFCTWHRPPQMFPSSGKTKLKVLRNYAVKGKLKRFNDTVAADLLVIKVALFCTLMLFSDSMATAAFILKVDR